jgi:hypothetical protein
MQYEYGSRFVRNSCKGWTLFSKAAAENNIILIMVLAYKPKYKADPLFSNINIRQKKLILQNSICHLVLRVVIKQKQKLYY